MFSTQTTLAQYDAAVPASKVIIGTPFFGIDWPTNNGTMGAGATGGAADIADSQAQGNGPEYWDPVTDTAWTSYQVGGQWHESYYEGENGLYDVSQMVTQDGARGVGIWALGMESDGAQMIAALDGISPGAPPGTGPQSTSSSAVTQAAAPAPAPAAASGRAQRAVAARPRPPATRAATTTPHEPQPPPAPAAQPASLVGRGGTDDHHHGSRPSPGCTTGPRSI